MRLLLYKIKNAPIGIIFKCPIPQENDDADIVTTIETVW